MFNLSHQEIGALGIALGAALSKLLDVLLARRKTEVDAATARLEAANDANANLIRNMLQHIEGMRAEQTTMREALMHCEEQHAIARSETARLERELAEVRKLIRLN